MSSWQRPESVLVLLVSTAAAKVLLLERTRPQGVWPSVTGSLERETPCNSRLNPNEHKQHEWLDWPAAMQRCACWTNQFAIEQIVKPRVR